MYGFVWPWMVLCSYAQVLYLFFSITIFSHWTAAWIEKLLLRKLMRAPKTQGLDPINHFGAPWWLFLVLKVARHCSRWVSAPFAIRQVSHKCCLNLGSDRDDYQEDGSWSWWENIIHWFLHHRVKGALTYGGFRDLLANQHCGGEVHGLGAGQQAQYHALSCMKPYYKHESL